MRSVVREDAKVGLLLFDEPSASLDPAAEHGELTLVVLIPICTSLTDSCLPDLFDRLRELRGSKTMVFSSHRFGNLTRHSDLILYVESSSLSALADSVCLGSYMNDSGIVESGTHAGLLDQEGEYARLWRLQAQAFI